jgi:rod shape-determining protein MreC
MLKRPHYIAVVLVVLLALILLNLPDQTATRLKLALGSLFLPLFGLANSAHQLTVKTGEAVVPRGELLRQNETLRRENQRHRLETLQSEEILRENTRLRQLLAWQQSVPWKLKLANVVLRDPATWWRTVQIDLGSRDGIRTNLPVLTSEGLVGRIASVSLTRAMVVLVGDPNCKVAAVVENESHEPTLGVLEAGGLFDGSLLTLSYLSRNARVNPGQAVITSGLGGIFPRGIPIGKIVDSRQVEYGLYLEARVELAANLGALEQVWVLTP